MFIKQISIQGFKSYKEQVVTEPFSRKHNAVVGRNGSGKSNFFAAIRFVLGDAYVNMSREERQSLLHEGSGPSSVNAFVEIVFDNTDNRFPTGRDEVILRRTIGLKKDEYQVDKKSVPKSEVMSLLESAGFSRSNPYYIVPQGRVTSLCNAKDAERLHLLKEVAGTRVYEQRRIESLKIMDETEMKRAKIAELLQYIEDRLGELEEEKEELKQFYGLDRSRRSAEYSLYTKEQQDISDEIERLEEERKSVLEQANDSRFQQEERSKTIARLEGELESLRQDMDFGRLQKSQLGEEMDEFTKARVNLDLSIQDLEESLRNSSDNQELMEAELENLEQSVEAKRKQIAALALELDQISAKETATRQTYEELSQRRLFLQSKQGMQAKFTSKKERFSYLKVQIMSVREKIEAQQALQRELEQVIVETTTTIAHDGKRTDELEKRLHDARERDSQISDSIRQKLSEKGSLVKKQKELWKLEAHTEGKMVPMRDNLRKSTKALFTSMDRNTSSGLEAVKKIVQRLGLTGVYGPLYELFEVDSTFAMAVDIVAGQSLFHVVVDTDETVEKILSVLSRERSGRVTFMPLNRLSAKAQIYPEDARTAPIISKLRFDPILFPAFQQVFGKSLLCANLEVASSVSRNYRLNGITLDGDRTERKGAITGGYHDQRKNRLAIAASRKEFENAINAEENALALVRSDIATAERDLSRLQSEVAHLETEKRRSNDLLEQLLSDLQAHVKKSKLTCQKLDSEQKRRISISQDLQALANEKGSLEQELSSPWNRKLSEQEESELTQISTKSNELCLLLQQTAATRVEMDSKKGMLESEVESSLKKRALHLKVALSGSTGSFAGSVDSMREELVTKKKETAALNKSLETARKLLAAVEKSIEEQRAKSAETSELLDRVKNESREEARSSEKQKKYAEKYLSKRNLLLQKKEEYSNKIKHLGALPEGFFEKYIDWPVSKLLREIHEANEELKKYSHVNKKAYEQYNNFTSQRTSLLSRKAELDQSAQAIRDLIQVLDQRKNEAIQTTFANVAQNFSSIFEKIVPTGHASLVMLRQADGETVEVAGDDIDGFLDSYVGVCIKVSFNSRTDEGLMMQQLSGGQKSVVALALIFAIQMCDPAPFYLFDEIDANLDAAYRTSVASVIREMANDAQFITTTFRPEMLQHADKFYGVSFRDRLSHIDVITRDGAVNFVEQEAVV